MSEEAEKQTNQAKKHAEEAEGQLLLHARKHAEMDRNMEVASEKALEDVERMKHSYNAAQRRFYDYEK